MLARLEEAVVMGEDEAISQVGPDRATNTFVEAFKEYGLDIETQTDSVLLERLRASAIRTALAAGLDDWAQKADPGRAARLVQLAREIDDDSLRNAIRDALRQHSLPNLKILVKQTDVNTLPVNTIYSLGTTLAGMGDTTSAETVFRLGLDRYPGDSLAEFQPGGDPRR